MCEEANLLDLAVTYAVSWHEGQYRKSLGIPYVSHAFDVMKKLTRFGVVDEEWLAAALLHDVVEDTNATLAHVENLFGKRVAQIVDYVTWPQEKMSKQEKWNHLKAKIGSDSPVAIEGTILKIADRVCNVEDYRTVPDSRRYACKYALEGFPVFFYFLNQFLEGESFNGTEVKKSLSHMEKLIQEKYRAFNLRETSLDEAEAMLFGPK